MYSRPPHGLLRLSEFLVPSMTRRARCCCSRLEITVSGNPILNGICHCDDCKRRTGSAFGWSAYFRHEQVVGIVGPASTYDVPIAIPQTRHFCRHCGSTLFWRTQSFPGMTGVAGGAFVDVPLPEPTASHRGQSGARGSPSRPAGDTISSSGSAYELAEFDGAYGSTRRR